MVFSKLSVHEKEAFFGLLDEYFQSRPEILGQNGDGQGASGLAGTGISTTAAASAVQRAFNAANKSTGSSTGSVPKSNNPYATNMSHVDVAQAVPAMGRIAAASLAFSGGGGGSGASASQSPSQPAKPTDLFPPSLPRRATSHTSTPVEHALSGFPGSEVDKLVTKKTSVMSAFKKPAVTGGATIPPAFVASKNTFGPPPVRRVTSETNTGTGSGSGIGGAQRQAAPEPEPEPQGEWAEVLYDYSSEEPDDLAIQAGTRVLVTARSSEDWWAGQIEGQGRKGLFPASYVKLL